MCNHIVIIGGIMLTALQFSHHLLSQQLTRFPKGTFIDATLGNGHDSFFILNHSVFSGQLIGFDIQSDAIINSYQRLNQIEHFNGHFQFFHDSHHNIYEYINHKIDGAIFNLGYLPGGDHCITTLPETTLDAIQKILTILNTKGLIIIVIYSGHRTGAYEKDLLLEYLQTLPMNDFSVLHYQYINQQNNPPELIAIERR